MERVYTASIKAVALAGLAIAVYLAWKRPIGVDEARLWQDLIRPPLREAFRAPDAWSGLLYAVVAERVVGLLRLSEFSLRLPAILSGAICAWVLWRSKRPLLAAAYLGAAGFGWFSNAASYGLAMALAFLAIDRPRHAGWLFGLAIAAHPAFAVLAILWWKIKEIERVVIPAFVTAFLLMILPASHAGLPPTADARPDFHRELDRRNAARGGAFQPPTPAKK